MDELVKRLRTHNGWALNKTLDAAADAIEKLQQDIEQYKIYLQDAINNLHSAHEKEPKWIPVAERLPIGGDDSGKICENVCLLMDDGTVSCGWMNGITKKVYCLNARDDVVIKAPITRVTHWQPLPEPPKEESDGRT